MLIFVPLPGNECCERLAYYGMSTNIYLYFKNQLNQHTATASRNVSNWSGTCYIMPLLGAFLADSYLGRYWTIASFSIIYVLVSTSIIIKSSEILSVWGWLPNSIHTHIYIGYDFADNICISSGCKTNMFQN